MESAFGVDHGEVSKAFSLASLGRAFGRKKVAPMPRVNTNAAPPWEGLKSTAATKNQLMAGKTRKTSKVGMSTTQAGGLPKRNLGPSNTGVKRNWMY